MMHPPMMAGAFPMPMPLMHPFDTMNNTMGPMAASHSGLIPTPTAGAFGTISETNMTAATTQNQS